MNKPQKYTVTELTEKLQELGWNIEIIPDIIPRPTAQKAPSDIIVELMPIQNMAILLSRTNKEWLNITGRYIDEDEGTWANDIYNNFFALFRRNITMSYQLPEEIVHTDIYIDMLCHLYDTIVSLHGEPPLIANTSKAIRKFTKELQSHHWIPEDANFTLQMPKNNIKNG